MDRHSSSGSGSSNDNRNRSHSDTPARDDIYSALGFNRSNARNDSDDSGSGEPSSWFANSERGRRGSSPSSTGSRGSRAGSGGGSAGKERKNDPAGPATRHARRLYFGGFGPHVDESRLRAFLNESIATALGETNDNSYTLSIYVNHDKAFAFVELKSIELASACLELDGLVMEGAPLKVQRANEYKPELVLDSLRGPPVRLDISKLRIDREAVAETQGRPQSQCTTPTNHPAPRLSGTSGSSSCIDLTPIDVYSISRGDIVVIGCVIGREGSSSGLAPASMISSGRHSDCSRTIIRNTLNSFSSTDPEFGIDFTRLHIVDIGDVCIAADNPNVLQEVIGFVLMKGGYPILIDGSESSLSSSHEGSRRNASSSTIDDSALCSAASALTKVKYSVSVVSVTTRVQTSHLQLLKMWTNTRGQSPVEFVSNTLFANGKLSMFGLKGCYASVDQVDAIRHLGGSIAWMNKDIRGVGVAGCSPSGGGPQQANNQQQQQAMPSTHHHDVSGVKSKFNDLLINVAGGRGNYGSVFRSNSNIAHTSIIVSIPPSAAGCTCGVCLHNGGGHCKTCDDFGCTLDDAFSAVELMQIAMVAGYQENVCLISLCGWNAALRCKRCHSSLIGQLFHHAMVGIAMSQLSSTDMHSPQATSQHNMPSATDPVYDGAPRLSDGSTGNNSGNRGQYSVGPPGFGLAVPGSPNTSNPLGGTTSGAMMGGGGGGSSAPGSLGQSDPNLILLESRPSQPIKHAGEFGPRTNFSALTPAFLHLPGVDGVSRHGLGGHVDIDIPAPSVRRHFVEPALYPGLSSASSSVASPVLSQQPPSSSSSASAYKEWDADARSLLQTPMHLQGGGR